MSEKIEKIRMARSIISKKLAKQQRRMRIHQRIYDSVRTEYDKVKRQYQRIDLMYAEHTKLTICKAKTKYNKPKQTAESTKPGVIPDKVKKALSNLPPEVLEKVIANYETS